MSSKRHWGFSSLGYIGVCIKLILNKTWYFHAAFGVARITLALPLMEIALTLIACIWTNCQLSLNVKDSGDLFVCRQAVFQNGTTSCEHFAERARIPHCRLLLSLFLLPAKYQESLKLMATTCKRKGNQRNIYSLRNSSIFSPST